MFDNLKTLIGSLGKTKSFSTLVGFGDFNHSYLWRKNNSLSLYEKSLYVNKAISKRAEKVGQVKFVLRNSKGDEIEDNEWTRLLDKPNQHQTGDQFWRLAQKYYDIVGSAFIVMKRNDEAVFASQKGKITSLELLRSDLVQVVLNVEGTEIIRFEYHNQGTITNYTPDQIIYLYNPDPRNPLLGESLISSAIRSIETEVEISTYHANVLKNGGKLESIFKIKNPLNKEQIANLEAQYEEKFAESKKFGRPLFMGGDIENIVTGLSPSELSFLDTKISTLNDICIATGVPKAILGVTSGETFANTDAAIRIFLRETIKPQIENIVNILDWRLIPDEFKLDYVDPTPEDQEDKRKNIETADKVHSLTINEKREMLGLDPIKNGDVIMVPFNLTPFGQTPEKPVKEPKSFYIKGEFKHPLKNERIRRAYGMQKDALQTTYEDKMLKAVDAYFVEQKNRLLERLTDTKKKKDILSGIYSDALEISLAKDSLLPVLRQIFIANGQDTAETFGLDFHMGTSVEQSLRDRGELLSNSIVSTSKEQLIRQFTESSEQGESRDQLVNRIESLYNGISKGRAEVIARTEVHAAMQNSNLEVYRQAGLTIKIWVTVGDDRVRAAHQALDGEEAPIDGVFSNGLSSPSEPNCRCTI
jgi:HK97 family phage portal protein